MRYMIIALLVLVGCESVTETTDQWFTQPEGQPSDAERVVESGKWLVPSPYKELLVAVVGGFAGFWTARRKSPAPPK